MDALISRAKKSDLKAASKYQRPIAVAACPILHYCYTSAQQLSPNLSNLWVQGYFTSAQDETTTLRAVETFNMIQAVGDDILLLSTILYV